MRAHPAEGKHDSVAMKDADGFMSDEPGGPIFIHSLFRAGSTWLFDCFRRSGGGYWCYQEPFHEALIDLNAHPERVLGIADELSLAMRHPRLEKPYFFEFHAIREQLGDAFRKCISFDSFFDPSSCPAFADYVARLIRFARGRPVLQCCRSFGRVAFLQERFGGTHIHLWRNPWDQWWSHQVGEFFDAAGLAVLNAASLPPVLALLRAELGWREIRAATFADEYRQMLLFDLGADRRYLLFYVLWLYSLIENRPRSACDINIDRLSDDGNYRQETMARLEELGIADVDLSSCASPQAVYGDGERRFFARAEQHALSLFASAGYDIELLADAVRLQRASQPSTHAGTAEAMRDAQRARAVVLRYADREAEALRGLRDTETLAAEAGRRREDAERRAAEQATRAERAARQEAAAEALARRAETDAIAARQLHADHAAGAAAAAALKEAEVRALQALLERTRASTSWRVTAPMRAAGWLLRGHAGAALIELGLARARAERLRCVAGREGGRAGRGWRVAFYVSARAASRLPGAARTARLLERLAPRAWQWLAQQDRVSLALASSGAAPPALPVAEPGAGPGPGLVPAAVPAPARPTRKVHQFHSGSGPGDAITNAMILIRRELRRLGHESEIFVEHRDPLLAELLREMGDLPRHDDYVLIVHHSMGYDAWAEIAALPARKILIYHNITPAEFLDDCPESIPYAALGRRQLSYLRPQIAASLADSEINALELRAQAYAAPIVCPLLFDVDALLATARRSAPRPPGAPFTILFVGRVVASKGQADLVDAFAAFRRAYAAPCRLVLVGSMARPDAPYPSEIRGRIALHGLKDAVLLTGQVSDAALHEWYSAADLYVSLSFHEGFGVPLVEAMAHDVPVLAWPAGAVPYTLGGAGELLADRAPDAVAATMLRVACEPGARAEMLARQRASLERFRLAHHLPGLLRALASAGAAPPSEDDSRSALAANLRFTIAGHVSGSYSLAQVNRGLALALEALHPGTVRLVPWENGPLADLQAPEELAAPMQGPIKGLILGPIQGLMSRPAHRTGPEVVISQHYPVHVPEHRGALTAALVFWEESLLPAETVRVLNSDFDAVFAPSGSAAKALIDSGVSVPVRTIGHAPDLAPFSRIAAERERCRRETHGSETHGSETYGRETQRSGGQRRFTFLHVSSCFPRKGVDVLLAAYAKAFRRGDPVRLMIKGFPNPHNDVAERIARLEGEDPDIAEIVMIDRDLDDEALHGLYREADAMVLPTRGEGFNLPAAEAMAAGIPLIVTGHGGHLDFCTGAEARLVDFRLAPSRSHVATPGSVWAEPDEEDLALALSEAFEDADGGGAAARAAHARASVAARLDPRSWAERLANVAAELLTGPKLPPLRVAWISPWAVKCGIAEYSRLLLDPFAARQEGEPGSTVILCDDRNGDYNGDRIGLPPAAEGLRVLPCWHVCDTASMERLARAVSAEDPDAVVIQHQPGLYSWHALARLLTDRRVSGRVTAVTLHAPRNLLDLDEEERAAAVAALGRASRVLVHRIADLRLLRDLGLAANVTLFPHGASAPGPIGPTRVLSRNLPVLVGCHGFFLPGKGIRRLIEAAARLAERWPLLRLRLVDAEYPAPISKTEMAACRALAEALGVEAMIEWQTAFLPEAECRRLLAECDLVVLPYDPSKESASGALRAALASGAPVAVTPVTIFDEAHDAVWRFAGLEISSVAEGIDGLLRDAAARERLRRTASSWLAEHEWGILARRLKGMLAGLRAAPRGVAEAAPAAVPEPDRAAARGKDDRQAGPQWRANPGADRGVERGADWGAGAAPGPGGRLLVARHSAL